MLKIVTKISKNYKTTQNFNETIIKSFLKFCTLIDSVNVDQVPTRDVDAGNYDINVHNYIALMDKKTQSDWDVIVVELEVALTNFSNALMQGKMLSEDELIAQREKHIFEIAILYELDITALQRKFSIISGLFSSFTKGCICESMQGAIGQQIRSLDVVLSSILNPLVAKTRDFFISLTKNNNPLSYGEVLAISTDRISSDIISSLKKKDGYILSDIIKIITQAIQKKELEWNNQNIDAHVLDVLENELAIQKGLFLLAILHIKKTVNNQNRNSNHQYDTISIPKDILTSEYKQHITANETYININQEIFQFAQELASFEEIDKRKYSEKDNDKLYMSNKQQEEITKPKPTIDIELTPCVSECSAVLFTPKKEKKVTQQISNIDLTPKKTNVIISYVDGSEKKLPVTELTNILNNNFSLQTTFTFKNELQCNMRFLDNEPKEIKEVGASKQRDSNINSKQDTKVSNNRRQSL